MANTIQITLCIVYISSNLEWAIEIPVVSIIAKFTITPVIRSNQVFQTNEWALFTEVNSINKVICCFFSDINRTDEVSLEVIFTIERDSHCLSSIITYATCSTDISVHCTCIQQFFSNLTVLVVCNSIRISCSRVINSSYCFCCCSTHFCIQDQTICTSSECYVDITNLSNSLNVISAEEILNTCYSFIKFQYTRSTFCTVLRPSSERRVQVIGECTVIRISIRCASRYSNIELSISLSIIPVVRDEVSFFNVISLLDIINLSSQ